MLLLLLLALFMAGLPCDSSCVCLEVGFTGVVDTGRTVGKGVLVVARFPGADSSTGLKEILARSWQVIPR